MQEPTSQKRGRLFFRTGIWKEGGDDTVAKFILRRILIAIPMVLVITMLCFMLMSLAPYDAVDAMVDPRMSAETVAAMKTTP